MSNKEKIEELRGKVRSGEGSNEELVRIQQELKSILAFEPDNADALRLMYDVQSMLGLQKDAVKTLHKLRVLRRKHHISKGDIFAYLYGCLALMVCAVCCFYHLVSEEMSCDKYLTCTVRQNFMFVIPRVKIFRTEKHYINSKYDDRRSLSFAEEPYMRVMSLGFNKNLAISPIYPAEGGLSVRPLINGFYIIRTKRDLAKAERVLLKEKEKFDAYMDNPEKGYKITGIVDIPTVIIGIVCFCISVLILVYLVFKFIKARKDVI